MNGQNVTENANDPKATIGFLPEETLYIETIRPSLPFLTHAAGRSERAWPKPMYWRDSLQAASSTGLQGRENQIIGTLSPRLQKARGHRHGRVFTVHRLCILDEPISGLDLSVQIKETRSVIRKAG